MKLLAIIPARGGSKGIPRKNIKILNNKPLIQYSIDVAVESKVFEKIIVSTDDVEIAAISKDCGAEVPFLRPPKLATDKSPTIGLMQHAVRYYEAQQIFFDAVCLLQPTSPMRLKEDCINAKNIFEESGADSLISVIPVPHEYNPHWVFEKKEDNQTLKIATGEMHIISRRQDLPSAYIRNGAIYITDTNVLMGQNSIYGESISFYEMTSENHVNLDTMEDWKKAETLFK